jgi:hypothetical protein
MFGSLGRAVGAEVDAANHCRGLFFADWLSPESVRHACEKLQHEFRDRVYSPAVTLWSEIRCQEPYLAFVGRPRGRSVVSRPSRWTVFPLHWLPPNGLPRIMLRRTAANSPALSGRLTKPKKVPDTLVSAQRRV